MGQGRRRARGALGLMAMAARKKPQKLKAQRHLSGNDALPRLLPADADEAAPGAVAGAGNSTRLLPLSLRAGRPPAPLDAAPPPRRRAPRRCHPRAYDRNRCALRRRRAGRLLRTRRRQNAGIQSSLPISACARRISACASANGSLPRQLPPPGRRTRIASPSTPTRSTIPAALPLYQKLGFEPVGTGEEMVEAWV